LPLSGVPGYWINCTLKGFMDLVSIAITIWEHFFLSPSPPPPLVYSKLACEQAPQWGKSEKNN